MAQDGGDEFALLKKRFPGTEEEDREAEREEAAREAGSGVANPVAAATPALLECGGYNSCTPATAQNVEATAAARRQEQERQNDEVCRLIWLGWDDIDDADLHWAEWDDVDAGDLQRQLAEEVEEAERRHDLAPSGGARAATGDAAATGGDNDEDEGSDMAAGSGVANPIAAVHAIIADDNRDLDCLPEQELHMVRIGLRLDFHSQVDAAWSSVSRRQYERFVQYEALGRDVKILLMAIRRKHLLEYFSQYDKYTLMQLDIGWWREVRVCPALFDASEQYSRTYLQLIVSDTLGAMLQVTPLTIANHSEATRVVVVIAPSSDVGYVVFDGHLYHES